MNILLLDNYDSFTYNLYQQLGSVAGVTPTVYANDALTIEELLALKPDLVVISPGPGRPDVPRDFGICREALRRLDCPVLGVCLGFQGLVQVFGGEVIHAPEPVHGRPTRITHDGCDLFEGIPQGFQAIRYHSLVVADPLPPELEVTARSQDGLPMACRHRHKPLWGIQFHPESICTEYGDRIIENLLRLAGFSPIQPEKVHPRQPISTSTTRLLVKPMTLFPDAEASFATLFGERANSFWLDSSRVCPGLSRFSFMGDATGPLAAVVTWSRCQARLTIEDRQGFREIDQDLFSWLRRRLQALSLSGAPLPPFPFRGGPVGYFGYEMKQAGLPCEASSIPDAAFLLADRFLAFDHQEKQLWLAALVDDRDSEAEAHAWFEEITVRLERDLAVSPLPPLPDRLPEFRLSRDRDAYLQDIASCMSHIRNGESYEICLTNRLQVVDRIEPWSSFRHLRRQNPAPYGALLRFENCWILSSSPEQFLRIDPTGVVSSKPIKGTRARKADPAQDLQAARDLASSEKDRAENLMIVDLLRNDLGKVCRMGSVHVPVLMDVETYATVHQLVSTVRGHLRPEFDALDCIEAAFPGGSMTGAPKLRTLEIIDQLEPEPRGIYSGCIGYLGCDGAADLSIVIRTAVVDDGKAVIGSGGAVVSLSDPEVEFEEMMLKAEVVLRSLVPVGDGLLE